VGAVFGDQLARLMDVRSRAGECRRVRKRKPEPKELIAPPAAYSQALVPRAARSVRCDLRDLLSLHADIM
jgi:hypothetical protein